MENGDATLSSVFVPYGSFLPKGKGKGSRERRKRQARLGNDSRHAQKPPPTGNMRTVSRPLVSRPLRVTFWDRLPSPWLLGMPRNQE